ncbi:MAG TPA: peroxiredoxin [Longimicrobiales bacterium]
MTLHRPTSTLFAAALLAAGLAGGARAQNPTQPATAQAAAPAPAPPAPAVGVDAPDFTAPGANASGAAAQPISLSGLKGQVVVLAFYPKDRTSGCTAEMTKFRDEYRTLFPQGVVVLPISLDDMDSHVGWAKDMNFPFTLVSDAGGQIATKYGSLVPGRSYANRTVFVIGKDGKIRYEDLKFGALDQHAYDALAAAIKQAQSE